MQKLYTLTCPKCGETWVPRVPEPKECAYCKYRLRYDQKTGALLTAKSSNAPVATPGLRSVPHEG
jgi:hypothetical protein